MYNWEKSLREDKTRRSRRKPSFSSILLDEIYRSIDGGEIAASEDVRIYKEINSKKQSNGGGSGNLKAKTSGNIEDEEMASLRRACLIEKWMEKKVNDKLSTTRRRPQSLPELDNDPLFFSTSSSSSDSSLGGFSSSEAESFGAAKSGVSCFSATRPKPIRTSVPASSEKYGKASSYDQREFLMFDDYHHHHRSIDLKNEEDLIKSKSKSSKLYANLKKAKQPISPGVRLASFINSLFTNGNGKKTKKSSSVASYDEASFERKSKSTQASTCSSASSYYRSCLSKSSANSTEKLNNGLKRTVRFYPVGVIVDEECRPCGQKSIYKEDVSLKSEPNLNREPPFLHRKVEDYQNRNGDELSIGDRSMKNDAINNESDDDDDDDASSVSSSDLFELDHLAVIGEDDRYFEELPVYETTRYDRNRVIANGLIR